MLLYAIHQKIFTAMPKLLLLLLLLLPAPLLAQGRAGSASSRIASSDKWPVLPSLPAREGKIYYEEEVKLNASVPKDTLFQAARDWLAAYYETAQPELQKEDREAGVLVARGDHHYQFYVRDKEQEAGQNEQEKPYVIHLQHTLHLHVQDGQYRLRIYDFSGRDEIRDLMIDDELNPDQGQVPEPRARRSAKSKKNREEMYLMAAYRSKLLTGLEEEVQDLTQSLKAAMAQVGSAN
jgi:hypothetical protein